VGGRSNLPPPADAESARSSTNVVHAAAERAAKAGGWSTRRSTGRTGSLRRTASRPHSAELLIDCEEDRTLRAVLIGWLSLRLTLGGRARTVALRGLA
jgi:hypothetical protein